IMAAARTNAQIVEALATLTNIVARDNQPRREDEMRLEQFMRQKPPTFTEGYNPDSAHKWLEEVEIIFEAMGCSEE
ncbi:cellular nucleic acid-binding protein, partial [Trifolium medium]|nr:cellular nucleic acid-binding protein [Trifolium medium]